MPIKTRTVVTHSAAGVAGALALGIPAVLQLLPVFEGFRSHAYLDPVGIPTICYGETKGVKIGQTRTPEECLDLLSDDVQARVPQMQKCLKVPVTPATAASMISFGYNVGTGAFCKSIAPLANEGRIATACSHMKLYVYAGGKRLPGLVRRRETEYKLCMAGLGGESQ